MSLSESSSYEDEEAYQNQYQAQIQSKTKALGLQLSNLKVTSQNTESTNDIVFEQKKYGGQYAAKNQVRSSKMLFPELTEIKTENRSMSFEETVKHSLFTSQSVNSQSDSNLYQDSESHLIKKPNSYPLKRFVSSSEVKVRENSNSTRHSDLHENQSIQQMP